MERHQFQYEDKSDSENQSVFSSDLEISDEESNFNQEISNKVANYNNYKEVLQTRTPLKTLPNNIQRNNLSFDKKVLKKRKLMQENNVNKFFAQCNKENSKWSFVSNQELQVMKTFVDKIRSYKVHTTKSNANNNLICKKSDTDKVLDPKTPVRRSRSKSVDAVRIQEQNDTRANNNETECIIIDDNDDENDIGSSMREKKGQIINMKPVTNVYPKQRRASFCASSPIKARTLQSNINTLAAGNNSDVVNNNCTNHSNPLNKKVGFPKRRKSVDECMIQEAIDIYGEIKWMQNSKSNNITDDIACYDKSNKAIDLSSSKELPKKRIVTRRTTIDLESLQTLLHREDSVYSHPKRTHSKPFYFNDYVLY